MNKTSTCYPEDITCVVEGANGKGSIFLGNLEASQNLSTLKKYNIKAVITASKGTILEHPKAIIPYYLHIPGEDKPSFSLDRYFPKSVNFIHQALQTTNVLVHCLAGISRSATLVIAYLIKYKRMAFSDAFCSIKEKRNCIQPNEGFIQQLKKYEKECQDDGFYQFCWKQKQEQYAQVNSISSKKDYKEIKKVELDQMFFQRQKNFQKSSLFEEKLRTPEFKKRGNHFKSSISSLSQHQRKIRRQSNQKTPQKHGAERILQKNRNKSEVNIEVRRINSVIQRQKLEEKMNNLKEQLNNKIERVREKYSKYRKTEIQEYFNSKIQPFYDKKRLKQADLNVHPTNNWKKAEKQREQTSIITKQIGKPGFSSFIQKKLWNIN